MLDLVILHSALPSPVAGAAPDWVHLVPAGACRTVDGRGPYRLDDPAAVIAHSMRNGKIAVDENHSIHRSKSEGGAHPARGWIVAMEPRADGIWGRVQWTKKGAALVVDQEYRGISPGVIAPGGIITGIDHASLTNAPNMIGLATLHSEQDNTLDIVKARAALGLPDTADEAAVLAAMTANSQAVQTHSQLLASAAQAAGVTAANGEELVTAIRAKLATTVGNDKVVQLQTQLDAMRNERARDKATSFIDGAIKAGKPIVAKRAELIELHTQSAEMVEGLVNAMPNINSGGVIIEPQAQQDGELTADEKAAAKRMGVSEADMKAEKKKQMKEAGK